MGLRPLEVCYSFSTGIAFRRQILTSKVDPRTERVERHTGNNLSGVAVQFATLFWANATQ